MSTGLINPDRPSPCHSATENQCFRFVVKSISRSPFAFGGGGIFHRDPTQLSAAIQLVLRRGHFKCDGILTKTRFRLSAKRTNPFKSSGVSVQSTTGSRGVCINGSNAGYAMFRGSVKRTGYPLHSPFSSSLPLPCVTMYNHISTGVYLLSIAACVLNGQLLRCYSQYKYIGCSGAFEVRQRKALGFCGRLADFNRSRRSHITEDWNLLQNQCYNYKTSGKPNVLQDGSYSDSLLCSKCSQLNVEAGTEVSKNFCTGHHIRDEFEEERQLNADLI